MAKDYNTGAPLGSLFDNGSGGNLARFHDLAGGNGLALDSLLKLFSSYNRGEGVVGGLDNVLGTLLFNDENSSRNFVNEITGYNSQQREFQQQEYLMDKQNEYNLPAAQMKRMMDAGINPNVAAAAIAGAGNQSAQAPSVPSAAGAAASGVGALSDLAGTAGQVFTNVAHGVDTFSTLFLRKDKLAKEIGGLIKSMGMTDVETRALETQLKYLDEKEALGVATMMANLDNICLSYDFMNQQMAESKKRIAEIDEKIKLYQAQQDYTQSLQLQADKQTAILEFQRLESEWYNNMRELYGVDFHLPAYQMLIQARLQHNTEVEKVISDGIYDFNYNTNKAQFIADVDTAFNRAFNSYAGQVGATKDFESYKLVFDYVKQIALLVAENKLDSKSGDLISSFMNNIIQDIRNIVHGDLEYGRVEFPSLPSTPSDRH